MGSDPSLEASARQPSEPPAMSEAERRAHARATDMACRGGEKYAQEVLDALHAAITDLAREAHLAGRLEQAERDRCLIRDSSRHAIDVVAEERDRLRALKENKNA